MSECPSTEVFENLLASRLTADQRAHLVPHLGACEACSHTVAELLATQSAPNARLPGGQLARGYQLGRYVVLEPLGHGAMGAVYRALDPLLDRQVAVKLLNELAEAQGVELANEARALAKVSHPNVVQIFEAVVAEHSSFLVMELVEGTTLAQWLTTPRNWRDIAAVFLGVARGLEAAHSAGLIHGDVKPSNVLVDQRGLARVADFGLGRPTAASGAARGGTPAYLAPEVFEGEAPSPQSDQFSFFVALFEALYGARPFDGASAEVLAANIAAGRPVVPANSPPLPGWLSRLVSRGLKPRAERFASMREVIGALEAGLEARSRTTRRAVLAVVGLVVGATAFSSYRLRTSCVDPTVLNDLWGAQVQAPIAQAFGRSGLPYAPATLQTVQAQLSAYATAWAALGQTVCEAGRFRGQSETLSTLQQTCLSTRREAFRALTTELAQADATLVSSAVNVVGALPAVADCADLARLQLPAPLPASAATRAQVEAVRTEVVKAAVLSESGKVAQGQALGEHALSVALDAGFGPAVAEAQLRLGTILPHFGQSDSADHLKEAVWAGEASNQAEAAFRAELLLSSESAEALKFDEAELWLKLADATCARLGNPPFLRGLYEVNAGFWYAAKSDFVSAVTHDRLAIRLLTTSVGETSGDVLQARSQLADALRRQGDLDGALAEVRSASALVAKAWGAEHPYMADQLQAEAMVELSLGHYENATKALRHADDIVVASRGADSTNRANILLSLAGTLIGTGAPAESLKTYDELVRIMRKTMAEGDARLLTARGKRADALNAVGKTQEALSEIQAVVEGLRKAPGTEEFLATLLFTLGSLQLDSHHPAEALAAFREELQLDEKLRGVNHPSLSWGLNGMGMAHQALGHWSESVVPLRRALGLGKATANYQPDLLAYSQVYLAKALVRSVATRNEGRGLARDAAKVLANFPNEGEMLKEARALAHD